MKTEITIKEKEPEFVLRCSLEELNNILSAMSMQAVRLDNKYDETGHWDFVQAVSLNGRKEEIKLSITTTNEIWNWLIDLKNLQAKL